ISISCCLGSYFGRAVLFSGSKFTGIHDELEIWLIDGVECYPIDARLFGIARQSLLSAQLLARLIVREFLFPHIFIERNPIVIKPMAQSFHIFLKVMEFLV